MHPVEMVTSYLKKDDWRVRENSNIGFSIQGLNIYLSGAVVANYWLNEVLPPECAQAHVDGALHMHDMSLLTAYCSGWSLLDLLKMGYGGVRGKVESAPPKHLSSALGQLANFFYTLQGETAGAVAVSNWDTLLAPFIRYDKLDYKQTRQLVQEFVFNVNIPTRVGFQPPFTNVTMDVKPIAELAELPVIIGGQEQSLTYSDFPKEMAMINRAFAEVMLEGDSKGRVFSFPIPTYNLKDNSDIDALPEEVWRMTAKFGNPYFGNYMNSDLNPSDFYSMCCRLRLSVKLLRREGGFFSSAPLTGSIGVVTINLAQVGYLASNETDFFNRLSKLVKIAASGIEARREIVESLTEKGLYPYAKHYLKSVKECNGKYWGNHFSTIGVIGMNEACLNLFGAGIDVPFCEEFSIQTLDFLLDEISKLDGSSLYNLEATPAEGSCYRLAMTDKKNYPDIITAGTNEIPYYTNSTHLPVNHGLDMWQLLEHQEKLQSMYTGGTVVHLFHKEPLKDWKEARRIVREVANSYKVPYFTLTPTFSICPEHGSTGGSSATCPICHHDAEVWSRSVGYLRPTSEWNDGKQQEFSERTVSG